MKQSSTLRGRNEKNKCLTRSRSLAGMQEKLSGMEGAQRSFTNLVILLASFGMLALTVWLVRRRRDRIRAESWPVPLQ